MSFLTTQEYLRSMGIEHIGGFPLAAEWMTADSCAFCSFKVNNDKLSSVLGRRTP